MKGTARLEPEGPLLDALGQGPVEASPRAHPGRRDRWRRYHRCVPILSPFRALRFDPARVPHLGAVLCPPYDVISAEQQQELLARDPHNAVRLELPPGDARDRYRDAARTLREWRNDGTLRSDPEPALYIHEMRYVSAEGSERTARGMLGRLRLEPLGGDSGVRPHERTTSGPKEDRYQLLSATCANLSPIILLHGRPGVGGLLDAMTAADPVADTLASDGVRHRLWMHPMALREALEAGPVNELLCLLRSTPLTIADGHHRYETALRYQAERRRARPWESDQPSDHVLALVYAIEEAPAVLATHRVVSKGPASGELVAAARSLFEAEPIAEASDLLRVMARPRPAASWVRFGLWTRGGGALLQARRESFEPLLDGDLPAAARWLDTAILAIALDRLVGIGAADLGSGVRIAYTKEAREAVGLVESGDGDACFLLDPTPVERVLQVAEAGGSMPQKSTYFHPKAPTGLLFHTLEA